MGWEIALAVTATAVAASVSAATAITGAVEGYQQGKSMQENMEAQAEIERDNARRAQAMAEQQAIALEQDAAARERAMRERNKSLLAMNRAKLGATGLDFSGTPLLVEIENAKNLELDVLQERNNAANQAQQIRYQGHLNSVNHQNQAAAASFRADQYGYAKTSSLIGGGLSLLGSLGDATSAGIKLYDQYGKSGGDNFKVGGSGANSTFSGYFGPSGSQGSLFGGLFK